MGGRIDMSDGGYPFGVCPADIPDWEETLPDENDIEEEEEDE